MEIIKALDFLKKYKTYIFLPIICLFHLLACFFYDFWIAATIFSIALLLISDFAHILYYTLFFQMFSSCGYFSVISTFVAAGIICTRYFIGLIKNTEKLYVLPLLFTIIISLFGVMQPQTISKGGVYQGASLIVALLFIYILFVYRDRFNVLKCAEFLVCGILVTAGISFTTTLFDTHISKFVDLFGHLHRLKLLTGNENSLAIYCSLALSVFVSSIVNSRGNLLKNIILGLCTIGFGLSTKSKCFLLVCAFILVYLFFMLAMNYKKKSIVFIVPAIAIISIMYFAFRSTIGSTIDRLLVKVDGKFSLSALTTNRSILWTQYINKITSSIPNMLFGVGLFNKRLIARGPHNLFIHILYRIGFVGIILLILLLIGAGIFLYNKYFRNRVKQDIVAEVEVIPHEKALEELYKAGAEKAYYTARKTYSKAMKKVGFVL